MGCDAGSDCFVGKDRSLNNNKPRIAIISAGGTIDALGASRLDLASYTETRRRLPAGKLLESIPEVQLFARVSEVGLPFDRRPSYALETSDWIKLAAKVRGLSDSEDVDGVVITHGTNTLEETAYFLHLAVVTPKPIVLTGAMRPASSMSGDGRVDQGFVRANVGEEDIHARNFV